MNLGLSFLFQLGEKKIKTILKELWPFNMRLMYGHEKDYGQPETIHEVLCEGAISRGDELTLTDCLKCFSL